MVDVLHMVLAQHIACGHSSQLFDALFQDSEDPLLNVETMFSITGSKCGGEKWKNCNGVYQLSYKIIPQSPYRGGVKLNGTNSEMILTDF